MIVSWPGKNNTKRNRPLYQPFLGYFPTYLNLVGVPVPRNWDGFHFFQHLYRVEILEHDYPILEFQ